MLEDVALKGKYYNGNSTKTWQLSNYAYVKVEKDKLSIFNADNSTVCYVQTPMAVDSVMEKGTVVFDVDKTVKYLKPFLDDVTIHVDDYITLSDEDKKATLPITIAHPAMGMIDRLRKFKLTTDELPTFGKTQFETKITVLAMDLVEASKGCDVVNTAKYKFDYNADTEEFVMSSERNNIDKFVVMIDSISSEGESSTVEFTGTFYKFMEGPVDIYLKDDAPILWVSRNRMLLKAPYLTR